MLTKENDVRQIQKTENAETSRLSTGNRKWATLLQMAGILSYFDLELLERYRCENRCVYCKKQSFQDTVTCGKCLEFEYCSVQCLELHREAHQEQCAIIGLKKGTCLPINALFLKTIVGKAKLLDSEDNFRDENEAIKELYAVRNKSITGSKLTRPIHRRLNKTANKPGRHKKKKRKRKNLDQKFTDGNKSSMAACQILLNIDQGKFGGPTKCGGCEASGIKFGQGWWKSRSVTPGSNIKSSGASLDNLSAFKPNKPTFQDFYPEIDEDVIEDHSDTSNSPLNNGSKLDNLSASEDNSLQNDYIDSNNATGLIRSIQANINIRSYAKNKKNESKQDHIEASNLAQHRVSDVLLCQQQQPAAGSQLWKCSQCGKESDSLKLCSRCASNRYCDQTCQKGDYSRHKNQCRRTKRFREASRNFFTAAFQPLILRYSNFTKEDADQLILKQLRKTIMVEIVDSINILFGFIVHCTNAQGLPSIVTFDLDCDTLYTGLTDDRGVGSTTPLNDCLKPGNFIILVNEHWTTDLMGVPCKTITDADDYKVGTGRSQIRHSCAA
ncbi:hypothetical protein Btru_041468, partial [Bulinus truncatus]